ncbi:MAG: hypothetical protein Q9176_002115 [Flavoplaca citrina]
MDRGTFVEALEISSDIYRQECKNVAIDPNEEGQSCGLPSPCIHEQCEDVFGAAVGSHIDQGNHDSKKAQNMDDQDNAFKLRQQAHYHRVHDDRNHNNSPENERPMPSFGWIVWIVQDDETLNDSCAEVSSRG